MQQQRDRTVRRRVYNRNILGMTEIDVGGSVESRSPPLLAPMDPFALDDSNLAVCDHSLLREVID